MDTEQDLVVFVDDDGNEITMEVLDYFFYEGQEYALLTEFDEACECEDEECEHNHEDEEFEVIIMRVVPVEDDQEEFVAVEDELMDKLVEFVENELYTEDDLDDEEEEEDE